MQQGAPVFRARFDTIGKPCFLHTRALALYDIGFVFRAVMEEQIGSLRLVLGRGFFAHGEVFLRKPVLHF